MAPITQTKFDIAISGAGIFGLSIAYTALKASLRVVVLEKAHVGAGSSGGVLGALMPHMPARWNPKKEFQFQALNCLEERIQALQTETGIDCGYRRCGRILPLTTQDKLDHHLERAEESKLRWNPKETGFSYVVEPKGSRSDWLDADAAPFGIAYETLAARVAPKNYLAALAHYVRMHGALLQGAEVIGFDEASETVLLADEKASIKAQNLVIAGGFSAFDLIETFTGDKVGRGEKGQALLLEAPGLEHQPAIYCDGLYVVPHGNGLVAVGSTSDRDYEDDVPSARRSEELLKRSIAFCPALKDAQVKLNWAGIRPRCFKRDPLVGRLHGKKTIYAATGGFKISFGIAHLIADALVAELRELTPQVPLPETFQAMHHFGANKLVADLA